MLTLESFIMECNHNNGIMVLLKALCKTMGHKDATIFHYVHCVSLSIFSSAGPRSLRAIALMSRRRR